MYNSQLLSNKSFLRVRSLCVICKLLFGKCIIKSLQKMLKLTSYIEIIFQKPQNCLIQISTNIQNREHEKVCLMTAVLLLMRENIGSIQCRRHVDQHSMISVLETYNESEGIKRCKSMSILKNFISNTSFGYFECLFLLICICLF